MVRPRWGLRASLIVVALSALPPAGFVSLRSHALARARAIEAVDRLHGSYGFWVTGPDWYRAWMCRMGVPEKAFFSPTHLSPGPHDADDEHWRPVRDQDVESLSKHLELFTSLRVLDLERCREVTDRGLDSLPDLPRLRQIRLKDTGVSEEGVARFRRRHPSVAIVREESTASRRPGLGARVEDDPRTSNGR